jgi:hypothetical protein
MYKNAATRENLPSRERADPMEKDKPPLLITREHRSRGFVC